MEIFQIKSTIRVNAICFFAKLNPAFNLRNTLFHISPINETIPLTRGYASYFYNYEKKVSLQILANAEIILLIGVKNKVRVEKINIHLSSHETFLD